VFRYNDTKRKILKLLELSKTIVENRKEKKEIDFLTIENYK
jgi:hypothetical protein